ncbi:hypothetical protein J7E99_19595 [Streptomyces sp. ISL-44]|uniref:hypothetical protein n=1 Tax=Streptomyces sp. ISL-44 TaxID=2819184 RepID=UPI001BE5ECD1|nr:hypothetical protein [Streptomyces sp. ISL-44]MBT2542857.1 hypothetical protein [Streptomyces sp. ISL-44]
MRTDQNLTSLRSTRTAPVVLKVRGRMFAAHHGDTVSEAGLHPVELTRMFLRSLDRVA